jgi:predicted small metal-binding protein
MSHVAYACRSTGGSCEWALEADSPAEILRRVAEHQKCAHHVPDLPHDFREKVASAIRTV